MREIRMARFIEGADRRQAVLLPESLDDYVDADNPVRVVDAYVDALDPTGLGFDGVAPEATGRPGYHPATLLKIYLYGYLNQVQSSRRLERECGRNLELIWLTGRLAPDFKTIADFRRDNGPAIRKVCCRFVALCRDLHLLDGNAVAIDGSKFKAVNHREKNFTKDRLAKRIAAVESTMERYLEELDRADREQEGETQISLTDPDARAMTSQSHSAYTVGYNVQSAVDTEHHLIVAHEVTNVGIDKGHLGSMAGKAREALGAETIEALADRGYFKSEDIAACEAVGIEVYVPRPLTSNARAEGRYDRRDFVYDVKSDTYVCPAGEHLTYRMTTEEAGKVLRRYWTDACGACALKAHCTPSKQRPVARWENEAVLDLVQTRLDQRPDAMIVRRSTVEHPFGTIKAWMGATHFKMKTLRNVATEMALHVLAYNIKRVIAILGVPTLIEAIRAFLSLLAALVRLTGAASAPATLVCAK